MTTRRHHATPPPGVSQGRRAALLRLRADLEAATAWAVLQPTLTAAIARIDALLTASPPPVAVPAQRTIEQLIPHLCATIAALPPGGALWRASTECLRHAETAVGLPHTYPSAAERRQARQQQRREGVEAET